MDKNYHTSMTKVVLNGENGDFTWNLRLTPSSSFLERENNLRGRVVLFWKIERMNSIGKYWV